MMSERSKYKIGCTNATNFELEIEDRGHLGETKGKKRGRVKRRTDWSDGL